MTNPASRPRQAFLVALAAMLLPASAAAAQLPDPATIATAEERQLLGSVTSDMFAGGMPDRAEALRRFDTLLAKLTAPTLLRGLVQFHRAVLLNAGGAVAPAREAVDESIRLLPSHATPLMLGSFIYTYDDRPARAADLLIRASEINPQQVSRLDEYEVNNLLRRLDGQQEHGRSRALSERLLAIGWSGASLDSGSRLALRAIEASMKAGDIAKARALVPKLVSPSHSHQLLIQNRYQPLWADLERWTGPQLSTQWETYLREARSRWLAGRDPTNAAAYARALRLAGHNRTLIRELLPLFQRPLDRVRDQDLVFLLLPLAHALANQDRWQDLNALYDRAAAVWPLGFNANALNVGANRARFLLYAGRDAEALTTIDAVLGDAGRRGGEVNSDALGAMQRLRACILHRLGRGGGAILGPTLLLRADSFDRVELMLCIEQPETAFTTLLADMQDEERRGQVIAYVQPTRPQPAASTYDRMMQQRHDKLRGDPRLRAAVVEHGRILPFSPGDGAPAEAP